jgi:hypothetical protein
MVLGHYRGRCGDKNARGGRGDCEGPAFEEPEAPPLPLGRLSPAVSRKMPMTRPVSTTLAHSSPDLAISL